MSPAPGTRDVDPAPAHPIVNAFRRRLAFSAALVLLAVVSASAGVVTWRHFNPPPIQLSAAPPPVRPVQAEAPALKVGDRRPDFTLSDLDGKPRSVSEWDGKLLFVNFWATWCPPCLEEIPDFVELQAAHGDSDVQFLGVALDRPDNVRRFMQEQGMNYPSLHGERDAIDLGKRYGNRIGALPYTVVVGRDGRVLLMHQGVLSKEDAERVIAGAG